MDLVNSVDLSILKSLYAMRDPVLVQASIIVSELGRSITIIGLLVCIALVLIMRRHLYLAVALSIAVATSGIGTILIKSAIARPRPLLTYQAYQEIWYSFPSAHASMSIAFWGFVIYLIWYFVPSRTIRWICTILLTALIVIIGVSRVYLGVHYLSDVIGGFIFGALCLALALWSLKKLR